MSTKHDNELLSTENNDDTMESSSLIVINDDTTILSYDNEKMANTILEQFFYNIKIHDDATKSAKCLLCHTVVKTIYNINL